jgi:hypothetical protein
MLRADAQKPQDRSAGCSPAERPGSETRPAPFPRPTSQRSEGTPAGPRARIVVHEFWRNELFCPEGRNGTHAVGTRLYGQGKMCGKPVTRISGCAARRRRGRVVGAASSRPPPGANGPQLCAAAIPLRACQETPVWCNASGYSGYRLFRVTLLQSSANGKPEPHPALLEGITRPVDEEEGSDLLDGAGEQVYLRDRRC